MSQSQTRTGERRSVGMRAIVKSGCTADNNNAMCCLSHHVVTMLELCRNVRAEAAAEREKSERLLHNILPTAVASELKE